RRGDELAELDERGPERHEGRDQPGAGGVGERPPRLAVAPQEPEEVAGVAHQVGGDRPEHHDGERHPDLDAPEQLGRAEPQQVRRLGRRRAARPAGTVRGGGRGRHRHGSSLPRRAVTAGSKPVSHISRTRSNVAPWTSTTPRRRRRSGPRRGPGWTPTPSRRGTRTTSPTGSGAPPTTRTPTSSAA